MADQSHSPPPWPRVSVVIPTLNEARNLPRVFAALPPDTYEVIVADGRSVDDTLAVVRELRPEARIVTQARPGRYNALACGCAAATGDVIALINADGSTDAAEIPGFVSVLLAGADFAKGTRFARGGGSEDMPRIRGFGNRMLTAAGQRALRDQVHGSVRVHGLLAEASFRPGARCYDQPRG